MGFSLPRSFYLKTLISNGATYTLINLVIIIVKHSFIHLFTFYCALSRLLDYIILPPYECQILSEKEQIKQRLNYELTMKHHKLWDWFKTFLYVDNNNKHSPALNTITSLLLILIWRIFIIKWSDKQTFTEAQ